MQDSLPCIECVPHVLCVHFHLWLSICSNAYVSLTRMRTHTEILILDFSFFCRSHAKGKGKEVDDVWVAPFSDFFVSFWVLPILWCPVWSDARYICWHNACMCDMTLDIHVTHVACICDTCHMWLHVHITMHVYVRVWHDAYEIWHIWRDDYDMVHMRYICTHVHDDYDMIHMRYICTHVSYGYVCTHVSYHMWHMWHDAYDIWHDTYETWHDTYETYNMVR